MENRLKGLKKAMDSSIFKHTEFTEKQQRNIQQSLHSQCLKNSILSLLFEAKSGIEITQQLHLKKVGEIMQNEGLIYTTLHKAESEGLIQSAWIEGIKYYEITSLGKKALNEQPGKTNLSIKDRLFRGEIRVE
jgi:DNA-binding PadR family transcriptional regulator